MAAPFHSCRHFREVNLLSKEEISRYDRQIKLDVVGTIGQEKLKHANVLIIGAGGLGCPVIQYLSAAGIGHITIVDGDIVSESNLQRQILYNQNDLNKSKAEVSAHKAMLINPFIKIDFINAFLSVKLALTSFPKYDLVIDCCDNFGTRYLVNDVCTLYHLPFISSALFRLEGQIGTFNVQLKNGDYSANYRDVFPETDKSNSSLDCNEAGVISTLPGIMGIYQANEALKYFLNKDKCCINKIEVINAWDFTQFSLDVAVDTTKKNLATKSQIETTNYHLPCSSHISSVIDVEELNVLLNRKAVFIVDVREENEVPIIISKIIIKAPLSTLDVNLEQFAQMEEIVFVCKSGVRSKKALHLMQTHYPNKKCYSFKHGIETLIQNLVESDYQIEYAG